MPGVVHYEVIQRVAMLTIDNPPVNALGDGIWEAIDAAVARAGADSEADAIVLKGAGNTFVAGADIHLFSKLTTPELSMERSRRTHAMLRRLEDSAKPLVAAIHGHALGAGMELALACHYRVATTDASVGQPEVLLGIIPGAGGTQRLLRLCGPDLALRMCTDGKPLSAPGALDAGILDAIASGDLAHDASAFALARAAAHETRRTRDIPIPPSASIAGADACRAVREKIGNAPGNAAACAAVDAIEAALTLPFDDGSVRERELFAERVVSVESKALRHMFFAEREAAKTPGLPKETPVIDIRRAAVVGAGTMGGGIAMAYAAAGIPVLLKDVDEEAVERGMASVRRNYESAVARGRLTPDAAARLLTLITPATSYDGFDTVDIVVEAVFEDMKLKQQAFAEVARVTRPECVLASNTSTLDVDQFARASGRPGQVVGHHFFSPANVMKLVEVVRGKQTSPSVLATSVRLARRLGKIPVVVGNCFGFVANRMLAYYLREAHLLLEEGASVEQIDGIMTAFGMPVGPFGMQDIAGIDVGARIRQYVASLGRPHAEGPQSEIPDRLFEMGRFGQKTSAGWYRYEPGSRRGIADPLIHELAERAAQKRGITRRTIGDDEVLGRVTTALANEGMNVLDQGFALRPGDIDVVYCHGFGFPRWRGGPMFFAETLGLGTVLARVEEYQARFGDHWEPAPLLQKYVAEGRRLFDTD